MSETQGENFSLHWFQKQMSKLPLKPYSLRFN